MKNRRKRPLNVATENATRYSKRRVTSLLGSIMVGWLFRFIFGVWTTKNFLVRYSIP